MRVFITDLSGVITSITADRYYTNIDWCRGQHRKILPGRVM